MLALLLVNARGQLPIGASLLYTARLLRANWHSLPPSAVITVTGYSGLRAMIESILNTGDYRWNQHLAHFGPETNIME